MVLTPEGKIAQYYYGVEFAPKDLRLGLIQASENKIGTVVDQVLLYCYHYDPDTGKYGAIISRVLQLAAGATVLILGDTPCGVVPSRVDRRTIRVHEASDIIYV